MNENKETKEGKTYHIKLTGRVTPTGSLTWERRHEFFEKNPRVLFVVNLISYGSVILGAILGLIFSGLVGVIIGAIIGIAVAILTNILSPLAVIKVREIERGGSTKR